ncbi:hypothetical protein PM082_022942 [Marasmius tenuissimus]|nr:hypothetical protein PM082_022942 [Marasmius tenuissimus]
MDQIFHGISPPRTSKAPDYLQTALRTWASPPCSAQELSRYILNANHNVTLFEDCIQRVRERQAMLQRNIARCESLLSPIRKLPTEILRRIFGFACAMDHPTSSKSTTMTSLLLSSVCIRWREITLHSPELWSSISIELAEQGIYPAKLALERSQQQPLSLRLFGGWNAETEGEVTAGQHVFQVIMKHSSRWCYVDFAGLPFNMFDVFDDVGATPNLKTVLFSARHAELIFRSLSSHTPRLPSLQYVECGTGEGYDIMGCPMDRFPWAGIRHCDLGFDSKRTPVTVFEALRLGGNLESLLFHGQAHVRLDQKPYQSREEYSEAVVSSLKTLSIRLGNYKGFYGLVNDFIYGVTLPRLNDLSISLIEPATLKATEGFELRGEWPRKAFCNFFKCSGCTLTTLVLEGIPLLTPNIVSVLRSMPQLQSFTLCELWAVPVTNESECSENSAPGSRCSAAQKIGKC